MRELCRDSIPWNRSLWSVSTQTTLKEVLECSRVRKDGILSDASVADLQSTAIIAAGRDPGLGDGKARKHLQQFLDARNVITPGSLAAANLEITITDMEQNYLQRWAKEVENGVPDNVLERCARCVVSHMLNRGHSALNLADRIRKAVLSPQSNITNSGDLLRDLSDLDAQPPTLYRAVFPVRSAPNSSKTASIGWMKGHEVILWLKTNPALAILPNVRLAGAVTMELLSRDYLKAAELAAAHFALIQDRARLGTGQHIQSLGHFWLSGRSESFPITPPSRGVSVASIGRQDRVFSVLDEHPSINRGIGLLAELDHGPSSAAVTSGWAALESLSMGPAEDGNRVETAVRVAALITASFVRAEFTTLAYAYQKSNKDQLAKDLKLATTNRGRAEAMMDWMIDKQLPAFRRVEDTAASKRMQQLISDPINTLRRINQYIECALKRLYRLRNLVAHGGRTDSIVLEAGVRAAAPMVGAAFDRIHHASISSKLEPVELIAKAQSRIFLLDPTQPKRLLSLLE